MTKSSSVIYALLIAIVLFMCWHGIKAIPIASKPERSAARCDARLAETRIERAPEQTHEIDEDNQARTQVGDNGARNYALRQPRFVHRKRLFPSVCSQFFFLSSVTRNQWAVALKVMTEVFCSNNSNANSS
jgi:hypothetical protein